MWWKGCNVLHGEADLRSLGLSSILLHTLAAFSFVKSVGDGP